MQYNFIYNPIDVGCHEQWSPVHCAMTETLDTYLNVVQSV